MHPSENGHMQERRQREKCQGSAGEESSKNILAIPHTRSSKKSHLLRKPHLTTLMEEVPSNEESCKSFSKMNRENTKYV